MNNGYNAVVEIRTGTNHPIAALRDITFPSSKTQRYRELNGLTILDDNKLRLTLSGRSRITGTMQQTEHGLNIGFVLKSHAKYREAVRNFAALLSQHFGQVGYSIDGLLKDNPSATILG